VHTARYCGLVEVSIAAHDHVRRLDPQMPTGIVNTHWIKGDYARALEALGGEAHVMRGITLAAMGRVPEAIASFTRDEERVKGTAQAEFAAIGRLVCEERYDEVEPRLMRLLATPNFADPEGFFHTSLSLVRIGRHEQGMATLARTVDRGFCALPALNDLAWLDPLRTRDDFRAVVRRAEEQRRAAIDAFIVAGGEHVVGVAAG